MSNPFIWLRDWCRADDRRNAVLDVDLQGQPQVTLTYLARLDDDEWFSVTSAASEYEEAIEQARRMLPDAGRT